MKKVDNHFTRQYNPEDSSEHHTRRRENLKKIMKKVDNHFTRQYNPEDSSERGTFYR
jgi:hypothetical protein